MKEKMIPLGPFMSALDRMPRRNAYTLAPTQPVTYFVYPYPTLPYNPGPTSKLADQAAGLMGFKTPTPWLNGSSLPFESGRSLIQSPSESFGWDPDISLLALYRESCPDCTTPTPSPSELQTQTVPDDPETIRLRDELLNAPSTQRERLIDKLRDGKSTACTSALAAALPRLSEAWQRPVRAALVERLSRLPAVALRMRLSDANIEIRRAAAQACADKLDTNVVPVLIGRLEAEFDAPTFQTVAAALKTLTARELEMSVDADRGTRVEVAQNWREWWARRE